jgi:hypothetical protein
LQLSNAFHADGSGQMLPNLAPGSADGKTIDALYRRVFGVSPFRGALDTGCAGGVFNYDGQDQVNCSQTDLIGKILLATIKFYDLIPTNQGSWRYLTAGEKATALAEGLQIKNVDKVRVYNKGYSILHLDNELMAPNGHIYVGLHNNVMLPWSEDYSAGSSEDLGKLVHELTHVFQMRTRGCITICMYLRAAAAKAGSGYTYMPLVPGKPYYDYNIEQQAEMVEDRFLLRRNLPVVGGYGNLNVMLSDLTIIPF